MTGLQYISRYLETLHATTAGFDWSPVEGLATDLQKCWREGRQVFLCGNGGSAANAIHLANDFLYGIAKPEGIGLRVTALPANAAVLTCLGNDTSYAEIFSRQLAVLARQGDLLIALSGSGNSPNILQALAKAKECGLKSYAILGFDGGKSLAAADVAIHFPVNDMQISEDLQMIVGHILMQRLCESRPPQTA